MKKLKFITIIATTMAISCFTAIAYAANLADTHLAKGANCAACHGTENVTSGAFVENGSCLQCHGPLEKLQQKFAALGKKNPHDNHLGEIECALCHRGHMPSESYCLQCHKNFVMPMK